MVPAAAPVKERATTEDRKVMEEVERRRERIIRLAAILVFI